MSRKTLIFLAASLGVTLFGGWMLTANKYYVKRFVKDHRLLYSTAKTIAGVKHSISQNLFSQQEEQLTNDRPASRVGPWALTIDASQEGIPYERFWGNLGYESFKGGLLTSQNRELFELIKATNEQRKHTFRYVRGHNLFSDGQPPWGEGLIKVELDGAGQLLCDWTFADEAFDRILEYGLRPIVEFGFMPDALASIPSRRQKWGKANISPPKNYQKWRELVHKTVSHLVKRYGATEVEKWYFEVWNEPDHGQLFWIVDPERKPWGDLEEYFKLYDYTADAAKAALPGIRLGGPATAGLGLGAFIEHASLRKNHVSGEVGSAIDFVSSHAYGRIYPENRRKGKKNIVDGIRQKMDQALQHDHPAVGERTASLPFLLTETGPSTRGGSFYNTRYLAAWWAKLIDAAFFIEEEWGSVYRPQEIVLWASEQVAKSFRDGPGVGVSLKTAHGRKLFKRPSFNALTALGFLSDERLPKVEGANFADPVHAIVTRDKNSSVEVLVYHLQEWDYECSTPDSQRVKLVVENLPFSSFSVDCYVIDDEHSNAYVAWQRMGKPEPLTANQFALLDGKDDLQFLEPSYTMATADRRFEKEIVIQSNSVALFVLSGQALTN